jgi:hypothetical protein
MGNAQNSTNFKQVLALIGGAKEVSAACGIRHAEAVYWLHIGRVPEEQWGALIRGAKRAGVKGVTTTLLRRLPTAMNVTSFAELIDLFPTVTWLARAVQVAPGTVRSWAIRNAVPVQYWDDFLEAGRQAGIHNLTLRTMKACARQRMKEPDYGNKQRSDLRGWAGVSAKPADAG